MSLHGEDGVSILKRPIVFASPTDGVGRTQNSPPEQEQRTDVMNTNDSIFHIDIRMVTCVHGKWSATDPQATTFIVFHNEFNCEEDAVVKKVKIEWEFINDKNAPSPSMPTIAERGPHILRRYDSSSTDVHDEHGVEAGLEGSTPIVKPALKYNWSRAKDYQRQYFAEARSGVGHASSTDHRYTKAWWIYKQNKQKREGVSAGFRIAVLLKRQNDSPFKGIFKLSEFDAGFKYKVSSTWNDFFGKTEPNDPVNFNPKLDPVGGDGIDPNCLGNLVTDQGVDKKYAWIWGVDLGN